MLIARVWHAALVAVSLLLILFFSSETTEIEKEEEKWKCSLITHEN